MTPHTHKEEPRSWEERFDYEFPELFDGLTFATRQVKSFIEEELSTREKEVREEILRNLPEEKIIHAYMNSPEDGMNNDMRYGWNEYRSEVIKRLTTKTEIR